MLHSTPTGTLDNLIYKISALSTCVNDDVYLFECLDCLDHDIFLNLSLKDPTDNSNWHKILLKSLYNLTMLNKILSFVCEEITHFFSFSDYHKLKFNLFYISLKNITDK